MTEEAIKQAATEHVKNKFPLLGSSRHGLIKMFIDGAKSEAAAQYHAPKWIPVIVKPEVGGEYNVTVDLEDGGHPVTATYDYHYNDNKWFDPVTGLESKSVLAYLPLPEPMPCKIIMKPAYIAPTTISAMEGLSYGQCVHGENLANCDVCNKTDDVEWMPLPPINTDNG